MKLFSNKTADTAEPRKTKPSHSFKATLAGLRTNRKLRIGATATAFTAIVIAVVILLNVACGLLADRFPWTLDLTADQTYSLSEESVAVAKSIKKDVTIEVLFNEDYFSNPNLGSEEMDTVFRQFYLFTKQYGTESGGHVTTKYVDLVATPSLETTYQEKYGATSGDILFLCENQYRIVKVTDLWSEDTDYYTYSNVSSLVEQKLASNISSVSGGKTVTVTFLTGHGEDQDVIASLKTLYELNGYFTQTINFATAAEISDTTGALVIAGPTDDYTINEIKRLRDWLHNDGNLGRNLFVFCSYAGTCPNLYDFLEKDYGITVTDNLVIETDQNNYLYPYPSVPITTVEGTDLTGVIAGKNVLMPLTLQLKTSLSSDNTSELLTNHTLVKFPESSRLISTQNLEETEGVKADEYPVIGAAYAHEHAYASDNQEVENYIMVCGSTAAVTLREEANYENEGLLIEPLRVMCNLGDAPTISDKNVSNDTVSYSSAVVLTLAAIFIVGLPLILIIICLVVFFRRRHL